ncbi:hypothetical protein CROQUDRAFT_94267 [Cronartium quercuum f. sp. fusiforme G11]|uniref:Uncharacterized protein n=1 Tax=Cronartium quercuum f. sp. fusiforme G11 TaxID=708437 RepID=A0A9P6NE16_9BASI|nr:hypothetical protein CROQUDRAFT_94267 [Cronartium quercuum f. sp. fusiforme G11]
MNYRERYYQQKFGIELSNETEERNAMWKVLHGFSPTTIKAVSPGSGIILIITRPSLQISPI